MVIDPKHLARQWNREIEAEARSLAPEPEPGRWKLALWLVFEVLWCVGLVVLVLWLKRLEW